MNTRKTLEIVLAFLKDYISLFNVNGYLTLNQSQLPSS
jgi:hypothetical protein